MTITNSDDLDAYTCDCGCSLRGDLCPVCDEDAIYERDQRYRDDERQAGRDCVAALQDIAWSQTGAFGMRQGWMGDE
jgi:hypothetical protein